MPISPLTFAIGFALICAGAFFIGFRFFRMANPPGGATPEQVQRFGRLIMMAATALIFFLIAAIIHGDFPLTAKG